MEENGTENEMIDTKPLDSALDTVAAQLQQIRSENPGMSWADAARIRKERFGTVER